MTLDNYQSYEVPSDDAVLLRRIPGVAVDQITLIPNWTSKASITFRFRENSLISLATLVPTALITSMNNIASVQSARGNSVGPLSGFRLVPLRCLLLNSELPEFWVLMQFENELLCLCGTLRPNFAPFAVLLVFYRKVAKDSQRTESKLH
jgi:hypothetical protein